MLNSDFYPPADPPPCKLALPAVYRQAQKCSLCVRKNVAQEQRHCRTNHKATLVFSV